MALLDELNAQMKTAMKAKDKLTLSVVRMIKTALVNEQIKTGKDLTEDDEKSVLATQLKQRKESLSEFQEAGREDLVEQTQAEIKIVEQYLPAQLDEAAVSDLVDQVVAETGATGKADFGKVMKALMPRVKGQADGALVNRLVKAKLN
ncbi:GatB/YqeY domain-containing protein [Lacticaseibacillus saniviri]|uniref:Glutaminyl-tRNA synthase b subunit n=1 Tax=Lacticaseibacillus saniviri JCM 17471 = DSM 24301 TaxID=1293598 RepID=A0A0R2N0B5_9LACO|nr:GatB/YqeY domain-containing protein [Lacticaseibacillus saniviri]KRO18178.1 glutaminyl-tRNA synthase b subunit [Lacticaseibacillus saniviri JCM 17471 = DSM 24301]MCG4282166.1 GatB/YqeY domain-containing protein [Lacticaseibacillus saniviri]